MNRRTADVETQKKVRLFTRVLFHWHKTHYRAMPWRTSATRVRLGRLDPYRVLVSEIMLQQTQVDRVRGKYREFLRAFPNVHALAAAPLGDVLRAWAGLGYNRRAKYLHECAKQLVAEHGGKFPRSKEELMRLPGVGYSTAAGVMAFAWNEDEPMIDTNVRRVLARVFFSAPPGVPTEKEHAHMLKNMSMSNSGERGDGIGFVSLPSDKELYALAKTLIPRERGRAWNYALLDLASTLCTARDHSEECPLVPLHGPVGDFVYKKPQSQFKHSRRYYRGRIIHALREAPKEGLTLRTLEVAVPRSLCPPSVLVEDLVREGLLVRKRSRIAFP